jgi:hypothetical protein
VAGFLDVVVLTIEMRSAQGLPQLLVSLKQRARAFMDVVPPSR